MKQFVVKVAQRDPKQQASKPTVGATQHHLGGTEPIVHGDGTTQQPISFETAYNRARADQNRARLGAVTKADLSSVPMPELVRTFATSTGDERTAAAVEIAIRFMTATAGPAGAPA